MKRKLSCGIILFIIMAFSLSSCGNLSELGNLEVHSLAAGGTENLKINKASDLNDKPSYTANKSVDSTNSNKAADSTDAEPKQTVFKSGDKGKQVKELQQKINKFGYSIVEDGDYGEGTAYAVMDFQFKHDIEISGIVSGKTLDTLNSEPKPDTMYKKEAQTVISADKIPNGTSYENEVNSANCPTYTNFLIMVSLEQQQVYIFNNSSGSWKLINTFSCASGRPETPTIRGNFYVGDKGTQFVTGNGVYCKYFSQISGNYLFHSILYDAQGRVLDSTLGAVASHGCIRLSLENAKYIYYNVPIGSGIWIH